MNLLSETTFCCLAWLSCHWPPAGTRSHPLYTFYLLFYLQGNEGENHKNNEHVNNSAGEQTVPRKSREKSHRAEKVSRDKCDYLGQPDSNCSVCKSQHEYATLFPASIVFEGHSPFSVPEAGDFLWFVLSLMEQTFRIIFPVLWSLPCSFMGCYKHWWYLMCENGDKLIWIRSNGSAVVPRLDELCPRREVSGRNNICEQRHHLLRAVKCGLFGGKLRKQHCNHL